jgi:predicted ATPase
VQGLIAARLDALAAAEKSLLQDAAVVGTVFWPSALEAISGIPRDEVDERLRSLIRKDVLRSRRPSSIAGEDEYAFHHSLVRDVAYAQIPRAARARKHAAAAAWLERLARGEDKSEMVAHHYLLALEYARAAGDETSSFADAARSAFVEAGDRAASLAAFDAAERFYEAACGLIAEDDPDRPHVLLRHGRALYHARGSGADVLRKAVDAFGVAGDRRGAAEALVLLGSCATRERNVDRARAYLDEAASLLAEDTASPLTATLAVLAAGLQLVVEDAEAALAAATDALSQAEQLGLEELRADALTTIGTARAALGDLSGLDDLRQAIQIARRLNSTQALRAHINLGSVLANHGDLQAAFDANADGRAAAERFGNRVWLMRFEIERLYERYWRGEWNDAVREADATVAVEDHPGAPDARIVRGWIRLGRGDAVGALADAEAAVEHARAAGAPQLLVVALAFHSRALLAAGREDEANAALDELLQLWRRTNAPPGFWTADLAAALELAGRGGELDAESRRPQTAWLAAAAALAAGEYARAVELYAEIGSVPDEDYARSRVAAPA